jgi:hypothetical protein
MLWAGTTIGAKNNSPISNKYFAFMVTNLQNN